LLKQGADKRRVLSFNLEAFAEGALESNLFSILFEVEAAPVGRVVCFEEDHRAALPLLTFAAARGEGTFVAFERIIDSISDLLTQAAPPV
jgi:hypothetical protein